MNILVIGLGSMGKRRIRLIKQNYKGYNVCGIDKNVERRDFCSKEFGMQVYASIDEAVSTSSFDSAFVCASPLAHSEIIRSCLENNLHVFTELNLILDGYSENQNLAKDKGRVLFLSSTFLYRNEIRFMLDRIKQSKSDLNYTYHVGQYLPDWHPWENYKDFFVGDKRTNGCRELLAVELPWLLRAFGPVKSFEAHKRSVTSLPLDYSDSYYVTLEHENSHRGQLLMDVVTRVPVRHFEVFGEDLQLEWRGKPEELFTAAKDYSKMEKVELASEINRQAGYRDFIVEDAYLEEIRTFFAECDGKHESVYSFEDDAITLALIDKIEA